MNIKTMAAIVGTLSLGTLATGCATSKSAAPADQTGTAAASQEKGGESQCSGQKAGTTEEKGGEHKCGANGCGGATKPQ
ncbi:hypothetical protein ATI61_108322 [Archangium gephyra]|uniref:Lipoprotein n=1 Tax=Archangium gephyra TaxID=48 RepID=A0AAC8Q756_9BACT|nr:hypothetical protein [Archangium gephyra]AKJ02290.1 Hypothetical protein AA314_03916 [Archangium gephyra]REG28780.1 hypothetical protein ATI61_108322 [Archangium gephyra]